MSNKALSNEQIRNWLEENCQEVSIMWRMRLRGKVWPRDDRVVICYNIYGVHPSNAKEG